jgi:hypothetical protein
LSSICILKVCRSQQRVDCGCLHPVETANSSRVRLHRKWVNMIIKGVSDIRGMRDVNTRPGPLRESDAFLVLYKLAAEKNHLLKKLQWVRRQKDQAEQRLSEIAHTVYTVESKRKRVSIPNTRPEFRGAFIEY